MTTPEEGTGPRRGEPGWNPESLRWPDGLIGAPWQVRLRWRITRWLFRLERG